MVSYRPCSSPDQIIVNYLIVVLALSHIINQSFNLISALHHIVCVVAAFVVVTNIELCAARIMLLSHSSSVNIYWCSTQYTSLPLVLAVQIRSLLRLYSAASDILYFYVNLFLL